MELQVGVGLLILVLVIVVLFMVSRDRKNKNLIETEIRQAGGEPIKVSFQFVGYDRDNQHYKVQFTDPLGRKHETRCKVNVWSSGLFWQQTPAELLSSLPVSAKPWPQIREEYGGLKEQLIDELMAENERLTQQLRRAEAQNNEKLVQRELA